LNGEYRNAGGAAGWGTTNWVGGGPALHRADSVPDIHDGWFIIHRSTKAQVKKFVIPTVGTICRWLVWLEVAEVEVVADKKQDSENGVLKNSFEKSSEKLPND
jgi:hypothetical protein